MVLSVNGNSFTYELEKLTNCFFDTQQVKVITDGRMKDGSLPSDALFHDPEQITVTVKPAENGSQITVSFRKNGEGVCEKTETGIFSDLSLADSSDSLELHCAQLLYSVLSEVTGLVPGWGILTGIRPSKLLIRLMEEKGEEEGIRYFQDCFLVSPEKTFLARSVAKTEDRIMKTSTPDSFSLYISIPFCPTRCSYCSFVSSAMNTKTARDAMEPYFNHLLQEIEVTAETTRQCGLTLRSVYVGGGTPSTLSAEQTSILLKTVRNSFDFSACEEFTFEAGRPDTLNAEKLAAIRDGGADRISINPQTMIDSVLKTTGRQHTADDVRKIFRTARETGMQNINMDLIAGLPTDTPEGFRYSLDELIRLGPESITVHTLAYKRSADLTLGDGLFSSTRNVSDMVDYANETLAANGYIAYYMYRQAKSAGNLENVGWCKPGYESLYNIFMMEECHTVLACGAGAVTKLKQPDGPEIRRIFNFKYPFEYNTHFEEQLNRKKEVNGFYGKFPLPESD